MISAHGISKLYGSNRVLRDITLSFDPGKVTALIGGNGAGKSTLLRILSGAVAPSSGEVVVSGLAGTTHSIRQARDAGIWMADQEGSLIPAWTVEEHFRGLAGLEPGEPWRALVPAIQGRELIGDLPQVERQLIEVALVCAGGTTAALFDEPTAGQGLREKRLILDALRRAASAGATVVWVTHDLDAALAFSDRVVALKSGAVVLDAVPANMTRADLLDVFPAVDRTLVAAQQSSATASDGCLMRIRLDRQRDEFIGVHAGEILGLVSNSMSRTREVLRAAAGLANRHPFLIEFTNASDRRRLAYMSRERNLDWDFTGQSLRFNLTVGILKQFTRAGVVDERHELSVAEELKKNFSVEAASLDMVIDNLSGGNRQKALLARLASMKPRILLLDEPFSGVDANTRAALRSELRRLAGEGTAVAIYSQEWDDLILAVDRVVLVKDDHSLVSLSARSTSAAMIEAVLGDIAAPDRMPERP